LYVIKLLQKMDSCLLKSIAYYDNALKWGFLNLVPNANTFGLIKFGVVHLTDSGSFSDVVTSEIILN